ncbi:MAG: hypothetical protein IT579_08430 [Verrucomicrobia subdivision 3 bacterium]|nr:hypothetical protein [Verrucomicrobiota bacterium]MCC6820739.1 hypothetical protein [Limisphaerales bacterium]
MDPENAHPAESRPPTVTDLLTVCRSLNAQGANYMVVGGFAVNQHGFTRATMDIDVLIDDSPENQLRAKKALEVLPDKAVLELGEDDLRNYVVVRICDEVVVDLMTLACGISYRDGESEIQVFTIDGVPIPFASAKLLLRTKQTFREKDAEDRMFLEAKIAREAK